MTDKLSPQETSNVGDPLGRWANAPVDWRQDTLWNIAEYVNGRAFKPTDFSSTGLRVIKITELKYGISPETQFYNGEYDEKHLLTDGDTLFAWSGNPETSLDAFRWQTGKALLNQHIFRVVPRSGIDNTYMYFLLKYLRPTFIRTARDKATSMGHVKVSDLKRLVAHIPPLHEQRAIASVLGPLDDVIELNRRMNETLEAMARAIFKSWFVDFDPIRAKLDGRKPVGVDAEAAALFPDAFQDSPLGKIPKGWEAGTVGDGFAVTMGQSPPGETYNESGEGMPFYQGCADFGYRYPTRRVYCTAPTRMATPGDTLVSVRAPVGDMNMASEACAVGRGVAAIRHRSTSRSFTYYAMRCLTDAFRSYDGEGTVFGCINKDALRGLKFIYPSDELVNAFEQLAAPLDQSIEINTQQSMSLAAIRDALLPQLLSGAVRVSALASKGARP